MLSAAFQPPDQSAANDQQNRNQLRSRHQPAKHFAAPGVVPQKLDEVTFDAVEDHERAPNLSIEFLAFEQPGEQQKIEKLRGSFDQLSRLNPFAERSPADVMRQLVRENDTPEMACSFAVTAARREASEASKHVTKGQPRREAVGSTQHRHVMTPHVPGRHQERGNQSAGKHASGLKRVEAENFPPVVLVGTPVVDDVKNLRPDNSGQYHQN